MAQFGTMSRKSCKMQGTVEVVCEPGKLTLIHCWVNYKRAFYTFHLTIVNTRTGQEESYTGKLKVDYPHSYTLDTDVVDIE